MDPCRCCVLCAAGRSCSDLTVPAAHRVVHLLIPNCIVLLSLCHAASNFDACGFCAESCHLALFQHLWRPSIAQLPLTAARFQAIYSLAPTPVDTRQMLARRRLTLAGRLSDRASLRPLYREPGRNARIHLDGSRA
jgi:hypothetical protein